MIYLKDGNIPLNLAYDDDIVQEANSTYQLSFKFPLTDGKWNLLRREVFLLADDLHGEQEFFIFEVKKVNGYVQVYAKQVATLLNYYSINTISVDRVSGQTAMTALAGSVKRPCPFTFFSDILDRHTFNESNVSVMAALAKDKHSIVGQWGGDLVRDKYQVKLLKNGGIENESLFMYKKNLSSYEESENINNLKTRLHLKKTIQGQSEGEADRVIAVTVDSPLIGQYRHIYEADIEVNDQDVTDVASLTAYGQRYFSSTLCDLVENSINLDVKGKSDVSVKMFDTVSVFHERFDVDLRLKITSYHFGPMSKRLKSIGFGKVSQTFGSTVASMVAGSVDKATGSLSASFEQKLQKEIDNANRHFDAEFDKRVESINDGIEQAKAEAELYADNIKRSIDTEIAQVNQSMQAQSEEHDRQVADILSKTQSIESLTNQAKTDAASALDRANQVKAEAIADARAQVATVSQALNTAKSELQTAIASADQKARDSQASATALRNDLNMQASKILEQARAQTALTNRVLTVETLADGTRSTVAELSKTVSKATGDITSVTSRTKSVEDALSQTRTQYETLTQTINTQTGQIDTINRKAADLQSGIDGVTERFKSLQVGGENLLTGTRYFEGAWHNRGAWQDAGDFSGLAVKKRNQTWHGITQAFDAVAGETYTFSVYVKSDLAEDKAYFFLTHNNFLPKATVTIQSRGVAISNEWKRVALTFTVTESGKIVPRIERNNANAYLYVAGYKLERGSIATDYSSAEEDLRSEIATYVRNAAENSAELSRQIQLADGKAVEAKTYAQQTAEVIKTRLESLETYKEGESTRASQYFTASRDETARQITAERKAIANDYVSKSIYDENVRGTTLKLDEIKTTADTAKQNLATYQNTVDRKLTELTSSTQRLDGKINTASAKVDTVAGQIRTEISTVEGKIPSSIGGENLLLNSGFEGATPYPGEYFAVGGVQYISKRIPNWRSLYNSGIKNPTTSYHAIYRDTLEGKGPVIEFNESDGSRNWKAISAILDVESLTVGVNYTFSADIYTTGTGTNIQFGFYYYNKNGVQTFHTGYLTVNITTINKWHRVAGQIKLGDDVNLSRDVIFFIYSYNFKTNSIVYLTKPKLETGNIPTDYSVAQRDINNEISAVKTTINQTSQGVEQLSTSLSTTNDKVSTAETKIRQLINDVSSKVSQTDYNTLTGRVSSAETAITQNAQEISRRLTSTQVESAITGKGYQTKSQVDDNITGRGYITSSALQPYALATTVQNLVKETSDSFSRTISQVENKIPTELGSRNYILNSRTVFVDTNNGNICPKSVEKLKEGNREYLRIRRTNPTLNPQLFSIYSEINKFSSEMPTSGKGKISFKARASTAVKMNVIGIVISGTETNLPWDRTQISIGTEWKTYSFDFEFVKGMTILRVNPLQILPPVPNLAGFYLDLCEWQLEAGSMTSSWSLATEDLATVTALHDVKDTVTSHTRTISTINGTVSTLVQTANGLVTEVSGTNGLKTQVSQLAGSWAVKNLTSSGNVLNQLNLNKDGSVKIDGKLVQITGTTYIQDGVITSAKIAGLDAGKINTGELNAARIKANSIDGSKIAFDEAFFNGLSANQAYLKKLFAKDAFLTAVQAVTLSASKISGGILTATNGAMEVNLNAGQIMYYTDQAALKRVLNGYPTQFVKFATGTVTGKGNAGVTVIGSNRWNSESSNDGGFVGIRAWNGPNIDQIDVVGDTVRLASSAFEAADGWNINTLPGKLDIDAFNAGHRASSKIKVGDLWLWKNATTYSSMRDTINLIIDNLQLLHNNKSTERGYSYTLPAKV
ncbi:phage tail spike protein [Streptococcus suis]|uniref:phage tail spike protein n=1 Tax=Streptococcus suis TaxID=1307 RepID=UPI0037D5E7F1